MTSVKLSFHIGPDGVLKLELPLELRNSDVEVLVVIQPITSAESVRTLPPETLGWPPGFFEQTAGQWTGEMLVREPQGEYEVRKSWNDLSPLIRTPASRI